MPLNLTLFPGYFHTIGQPSIRFLALRRPRALFRPELDAEGISDIRLALNQNQPLGNDRFYTQIEQATGIRRAPHARSRPAKKMIDVASLPTTSLSAIAASLF